MVQVDGGADRSTTPHRELVHGFRPPDVSRGAKITINDAGAHPHAIIGYGYHPCAMRMYTIHSVHFIELQEHVQSITP